MAKYFIEALVKYDTGFEKKIGISNCCPHDLIKGNKKINQCSHKTWIKKIHGKTARIWLEFQEVVESPYGG